MSGSGIIIMSSPHKDVNHESVDINHELGDNIQVSGVK